MSDEKKRLKAANEAAAMARNMTNWDESGWLIHKAGRGYYRPNAQGYTFDLNEAGRYSYTDAVRHSHPNGPDGPRDGMTIIHEYDAATGETNG